MNPYHLLWIIPLANLIGLLFGLSAGMYFSRDKFARIAALYIDRAQMAARGPQKK